MGGNAMVDTSRRVPACQVVCTHTHTHLHAYTHTHTHTQTHTHKKHVQGQWLMALGVNNLYFFSGEGAGPWVTSEFNPRVEPRTNQRSFRSNSLEVIKSGGGQGPNPRPKCINPRDVMLGCSRCTFATPSQLVMPKPAESGQPWISP